MTRETTPKDFKISYNHWKNQLKQYLGNFENKSLLLPNQLEFKPLAPEELGSKPVVIAIDTETFEKNGNLICLCNSENEEVLTGTTEKQPTLEEYFKYLAKLSGNRKNVCFFAYNLKFDASILLKTLGVDLKQFYEDDFEGKIDGIKVKYLNKKCLMLSKGRQKVNIFDALQYFIGAGENGGSSLDSVAKAYLGEQKEYTGKYQNKKFPDQIEHTEMIQIVKYCMLDCKLTKKLMDIWINAFYDNFGFYPNKYYSAGFVSVQVLKTKLNSFPSFRKAPFLVQEMAYKSYFGGRFEIMEKGLMENIHHYDIKSAYPSAMAQMPDFTRGKWVTIRNKEDYERHEAKGLVGFYKIHVDVKEENLTPFVFRNELGQVLTPQGEFITYTTGSELDVALDYYDFELKKIAGYAFKPDNNDETEFNRLIKEMYDLRMKQTNEGQKYVYKVIINSLYGKTAQSKPEPKGLFSPILCAYITGHCRAELLKVAKNNKKDIVMFATDGIFSKKPLDVKLGKQLGEFDYEFHPKFLLIMAGVYSYNTKENPQMNTRSRGFSLRTFDKDEKELKFDLDSYRLIKDNDRFYYEIRNIRPVALTQAVIQHKYTPELVGKMEFIRKEIDLNGDKKRLWYKRLSSINDNARSEAIKLL
jgi:hypothetical protein